MAIGMEDEPAPFGIANVESEGVELMRGTEPDETIAASLGTGFEILAIVFADRAMNAIGANNQIVAGPLFRLVHHAAIVYRHTQRQCALAQDAQ